MSLVVMWDSDYQEIPNRSTLKKVLKSEEQFDRLEYGYVEVSQAEAETLIYHDVHRIDNTEKELQILYWFRHTGTFSVAPPFYGIYDSWEVFTEAYWQERLESSGGAIYELISKEQFIKDLRFEFFEVPHPGGGSYIFYNV